MAYPALRATIHTSKGDIKLDLFPDKAPVTVLNFVNLVSRGYYDGLVFHRVIPDFHDSGEDALWVRARAVPVMILRTSLPLI